jgi:hypothetical protein
MANLFQGRTTMLERGDYSEKRDFMRMAVDCPMTFCIRGEGTAYHATARDLSASGLLIVCQQEIPEGSLLEVSVQPEQSLVSPLQAVCEVMRVSSPAPGRFELGVKINEILPSGTDQA